MDRELSVQTVKNRKRKRILQILFVLLPIVILLFAFRILIRPSIHLSEIQTVFTNMGDIEATIPASGLILPEFEEVISSPITSRIIYVYRNVGETVHRGDTILSLDKSNEQLTLDKLVEELGSKENQKRKLQLSIQRTLIDLQTNFEIQRLRSESLHKSYENEKYINSLGGTTQEMVKQAELNSQIAQLEINHLQQNIDNQKASMQTDLIDQEYIINIQKKDIEKKKKRLANADVKANGTGVVTWVNDKIGSTVVTGQELVKLSNLNSFKVEGSVSDIYHNKLAVARTVLIGINDSIIEGSITAVNPTVQNDAVKFTVMPSNKSHSALRSNQKVDIYVITAYRKNVVRMPRKNWINRSSNPYVFVRMGNKAIRKTVQFGESNFDYVEIVNGLKPGEEVIISDMEDKMHLKEVKVKE